MMKMVNEVPEDKVGRVTVLGSQGVGKTVSRHCLALVVRCLTRRFLPEYAPYKELSYRYKRSLKEGGKDSEMIITDSDGQNSELFSSTEAFIFVYSVTSLRSLETIEKMIKNIKYSTKNEPYIIIIGNQIDLIQKREVSRRQGESLAFKSNAEYYETSVADANQVDYIINIFQRLHQKLYVDNKKRRTQSKLMDMFKRRGST